MKQSIAAVVVALTVMGGNQASAQETVSTPGTVVVTIVPGGATFFTEGKKTNGPSFGNYGVGGAVAVNFNRWVGVEGDVNGAIGVVQHLHFVGATSNTKTPNLVNYSGNLVVFGANHTPIVPYATGGIGGLTVFDKASLGITHTDTFLTSSVGGGVQWFSGRWGLRGDYRFIAVQSKDDASAFFGRDRRDGHRVYGAVLLNVVK